MPRDTFHDYVTDQEACDCAAADAVNQLVRQRISALDQRSGASNVANSIMLSHYDPSSMALRFQVRFSSRAWTG